MIVTDWLVMLISKQVIFELLEWNYARNNQLIILVAKGILSSIGTGDANGVVFLHTVHNETEPPTLCCNISWRRMRSVFFVHDLIPMQHPECCHVGGFEKHRLRIKSMLNKAVMFTNSQSTFSHLVQFARANQLLVPQVFVAPLAPPSQPTRDIAARVNTTEIDLGYCLKMELQQKSYFVMLGTVEPRKNHALLLQIWSKFALEASGNRPHLVIIGQSGLNCEELEGQLRDKKALDRHVHWIEHCSDVQLHAWLLSTRALLFPSLAEGFGMPIAEALTMGTPVITSNLEVSHEFAADVPLCLSLHDAQAWQLAIVDYARPTSAMRAAQCDRIQNLKLPSWQEHFTRVDELLVSLDLATECDAIECVKRLPHSVSIQERK
jgi:glycosyltransferase involved in cell wall biosynthesis